MQAADDTEPPNQQKTCNNTSRISTFLRVKPVAKPTSRILLEPLDGNVEFRVPRDIAAGCVGNDTQQTLRAIHDHVQGCLETAVLFGCRPVNNSRERYSFTFDGILTPEAKQDEVRHLDPVQHLPHKDLEAFTLQRLMNPVCRRCLRELLNQLWSAHWKATMVLSLHMARQALVKPSPSLEELSVTWTEV